MKHYALLLLLHVISTSCMENDTTTPVSTSSLSVTIPSSTQPSNPVSSVPGGQNPPAYQPKVYVLSTCGLCSVAILFAIVQYLTYKVLNLHNC